MAGFLLVLVVSHGSLMAGLGALALIAGAGWIGQKIFERRGTGGQDD